MAEQIQNTDYSKYDKFLVNEEKQPSDIVVTPTTEKKSDISKYDKFIVSEDKQDTPVISDSKYDKFIVSESTSEIKPTITTTGEEPSWFRKFLYGFDKQDQFFGNLYRIGKAKVQDVQDDNRNLKEVLQDNAGIENQKLLNRFNEFRGGKYDDDIYTKAGEMASLLLDPFYLMAYLTPWGRAATASYKGLALIGGTTVGLDKLISDLLHQESSNLKMLQ